MAIKLVLELRKTSPPHLYLDRFKEIIKDDEYLLPATRGYLNFMKKSKRTWVPLALQMEVVISSNNHCNLSRGLSPNLTDFNKLDWTEEDIERWNINKNKFLEDIKKLYNKIGYDIKELELDENIVKQIIETFNKKVEKFKQMKEKQSGESINKN